MYTFYLSSPCTGRRRIYIFFLVRKRTVVFFVSCCCCRWCRWFWWYYCCLVGVSGLDLLFRDSNDQKNCCHCRTTVEGVPICAQERHHCEDSTFLIVRQLPFLILSHSILLLEHYKLFHSLSTESLLRFVCSFVQNATVAAAVAVAAVVVAGIKRG